MRNTDNPILANRLHAFDAYFESPDSPLRITREGKGTFEGWFLGPKAENERLLIELVVAAIRKHSKYRREFHPEDPVYITREIKESSEYREAVQNLKEHASNLYDQLRKSVPFFSMRYQGHMLWDQSLPAMVGYFGAMLYNQNNVAAEASPLTTWLEIQVGNQLCQMLGFSVPPPESPSNPNTVVPWGHITCDGSVANIEALWAARNAKFYAVALREALMDPASGLSAASGLTVKLLDGSTAPIIDLDTWTLLNLKIDDVVSLPYVMEQRYGISTSMTNTAIASYSLPSIGMVDFYRKPSMAGIAGPVALVPTTRHYSWPKAGTLLGLGQNNILKIHVDPRARMDVVHLEGTLQACLNHRKPVIAVVAVIGSTEESAVDPLAKIIKVRETWREQGLDFAIHCDAAWGGYFASMLRKDEKTFVSMVVPEFPMSEYVCDQYRALKDADSITVDPHKAGYVPYPAGALCYRNSAMRSLISLKAPVVFHSESEPTVGIYGVEGSKPGAAAAAVWLAHQVIRPTQAGYGKILGQCMWTSKRMYCRLYTMRDRDKQNPSRFKIELFQELPGKFAKDIEEGYIRQFVDLDNRGLRDFLARDPRAKQIFMELGSDQVILAYSFNFFDRQGRLNSNAAKMNSLNDKIFEICSITSPTIDLNSKKLILTSSAFDEASYGPGFVQHYCQRLGVDSLGKLPISFLISTTMDPWTTDTPHAPSGGFLAVMEDALREAVHQALADLGWL